MPGSNGSEESSSGAWPRNWFHPPSTSHSRQSQASTRPDDCPRNRTHRTRHVRGLVKFQWLTGCRPGEACRLRRCDIEMGGTVWLYKPKKHKTAWRGKSRTVVIGPKAQELLP